MKMGQRGIAGQESRVDPFSPSADQAVTAAIFASLLSGVDVMPALRSE